MPDITINIDKWKKLTKKDFVLQYLFKKAKGNRRAGEAPASEIYHGWVQACLQLARSPGKLDSFQHEMWVLKDNGVVDVSRKEPCGRKIMRNHYILTTEYFDYLNRL